LKKTQLFNLIEIKYSKPAKDKKVHENLSHLLSRGLNSTFLGSLVANLYSIYTDGVSSYVKKKKKKNVKEIQVFFLK
jgi:uncharacterized metal-binding protein